MWILEADAINVVRATQGSSSRALKWVIIEEIKEEKFKAQSGNVCCYTSRHENNVACFLNNLVFSILSDLLCLDFFFFFTSFFETFFNF